jgi:hypothetical protein
MRQIPDHFDEIHFTESRIGVPKVVGDSLLIPASGLLLMSGHPLLSQTDGPVSGIMVFKGVETSTRTIIEYIGDPKNPRGFKEPRQEHDGPFLATTADECREFEFEGLLESPPAWIDNWVVLANRFILQLNDL